MSQITCQDAAVRVTVNVTVPASFYDLILNYPDVFSTDYIGYWGRGTRICHDGVQRPGVWLVTEQESYREALQDCPIEARVALAAEARNAVVNGTSKDLTGQAAELASFLHVLDTEAVTRAAQAGIEKFGLGFPEDYDGHSLDYALQVALLGSEVYG